MVPNTSGFQAPEQACHPGAPMPAPATPPLFVGTARDGCEKSQTESSFPRCLDPTPLPRNAIGVSTSSSLGAGDGCFPPPVPLPRPGGSILQQARAHAPAQHLAVLRALLDGGDDGAGEGDGRKMSDEIVSSSDTDDGECAEDGFVRARGRVGKKKREGRVPICRHKKGERVRLA